MFIMMMGLRKMDGSVHVLRRGVSQGVGGWVGWWVVHFCILDMGWLVLIDVLAKSGS